MRVICFGDSNTYGFDPRSYFGSRFSEDERWVNIFANKTGWSVINEGVNGREARDCKVVLSDNVDFFIIMVGTNDVLQGRSAEETAERIETVLKACQSERIILIAPPLLRFGDWVTDTMILDESFRLSEEYERVAKKTGVYFADAGEWNIELLYDGVHFSERGHRSFAEGLYCYFKNLLKSRGIEMGDNI